MQTILDRWNQIQEAIDRVSKNKNVTVVAVSKKQPFKKIQEAYEVGVRHFGENYVQEALPKIEEAHRQSLAIQWHYVGALQTNKMNKIVPAVQYIHSIGGYSQIEKLEKMREQGIMIPKLFIQLNLADEDTKSGLIEKKIQIFLENVHATTLLQVDGLMTFPPLQADPEKNRSFFAKAREWKEKVNGWKLNRIHIQDLSMGVSNDYCVAIEEGSTMVRLGEALFGPRS